MRVFYEVGLSVYSKLGCVWLGCAKGVAVFGVDH